MGKVLTKRTVASWLAGVAIVGIAAILSVGTKYQGESGVGKIRAAFGSHWKTIHPGEQHTLVGDLVTSNQFEALVGINNHGQPIPLGAKEWRINKDSTEFTFTIDQSRRFSDGTLLKASDYKNAWEDALRLSPKASNNSLLDVLYKIKGFEDFEAKGTITGLIARDPDLLVIEFKSPFRMALDHLAGNRFAAYKEINGKYIGTGQYQIEEFGQDQLSFSPNPYSYGEKDEIDLTYVHSGDAAQAIIDGQLDVFGYGRGADVPEDLDSSVGVIVGQDALHETIFLNRRPGHLFEKKEHRLALQYLLTTYMRDHTKLLGNPKYWDFDEQIYLPFQAGRLSDAQVAEIISSGKKHVPALIEAANAKPVVLDTAPHSLWIKEALEDVGIEISEESTLDGSSDIFKEIYQDMESDIVPFIFSVAVGDPDGIYHMLGQKGAIQSPMIYSPSVGTLLEQGRQIIDRDELDAFYKKVSEETLKDVPFVHLGFSKAVALYSKERIDVLDADLRRNEGHLHHYRIK